MGLNNFTWKNRSWTTLAFAATCRRTGKKRAKADSSCLTVGSWVNGNLRVGTLRLAWGLILWFGWTQKSTATNQPIWKICSSKLIISTRIGVNKNIFETFWNHHLVIYIEDVKFIFISIELPDHSKSHSKISADFRFLRFCYPFFQTHRIHVWYICLHGNHKNQRNPWIGKYTIPMDPSWEIVGIVLW